MILDTQYQIGANISLTEVEDEIVLLNLNNGAYYGLNHIGAHLIRAIENQTPLNHLIRQIAEQYQMDYKSVNRDIDQLIVQLVEQSLLVQSDPSA